MIDFVNYVINGALIGLLYALIAMGFVVIYRASKVFNFAQGELVVFGGFIVWWLVVSFGLPLYVGLPLAFVIAAAFGLLIERMFFSRLVGESVFAMVMVTIGLLILIRGVVQVMEGRHCFAHLTIEENLMTGSYTRTSKGEIEANLEKVYNYFPRLKTRRTSQAAYTMVDAFCQRAKQLYG